MLDVDHFEQIRRMYYIDGLSQRAIAKKLGHSRKTIRKAIENAAPPSHQSTGQVRAKPTLGEFTKIIDAWLDEDLSRPRKQRHTAKRVYDRLVAEHDYCGHSSTIRRYVGRAKRSLVSREVFVPLQFDPGEEAQVDWGEASIIENGVRRKVQLFCIKLCHSGHSFVRAYDHANLESFLDGHVRAFEFFGGIPQRLAYDNLKSAVIQVGRGKERRLNVKFKELRSWYLFESRFCNVARGNEKGHVENLVKWAQRNLMTPLPEVSGIAELNVQLGTGRQPYTDASRWQEEKSQLRQIDVEPYPACKEASSFVDKQSLVHIARHSYSVPIEWAYQPCVVRAFVDRVEVHCEQQLVACHERSYSEEPFVLDPMHYIPVLQRKPGCLDHARPFKGCPWGPDFQLLRDELEYRYGSEGTRQFIAVLLLFKEHGESDVRQAVKDCVARRAFNEQAVRIALQNHPTVPPPKRLDLFTRPELRDVGEGVRPASTYNQLLN